MTEVYNQTRTALTANSEKITFANGTVASGVICTRYTPLAVRTADAQIVLWDPTASDGSEKAVFLSALAMDTTDGSVKKEVVKGGYFNSDAIQWPEAATDIHKALAFTGTPISHSIVS